MSAVQGNRAHDAVDRGSPTKVGGKTIASYNDQTAVAAGDRVDAWFDVNGAQIMDLRPSTWVESASSISSVANSVTHAGENAKTHFITGITVTYRAPLYRQVDVYKNTAILFSFHSGTTAIPFVNRAFRLGDGDKIVVEAAAAGSASGDCYINLFGYTKDN